jgi:hypothetical protein
MLGSTGAAGIGGNYLATVPQPFNLSNNADHGQIRKSKVINSIK